MDWWIDVCNVWSVSSSRVFLGRDGTANYLIKGKHVVICLIYIYKEIILHYHTTTVAVRATWSNCVCVAEHYPFLSIWFDNFQGDDQEGGRRRSQCLSTHTQSEIPQLRSFSMCFPSRCDLEAACKLSIDRSMIFYFSWWTPTPLLFNLYDSH